MPLSVQLLNKLTPEYVRISEEVSEDLKIWGGI